tara:strand:+ start:320 stop:2089 length:1770 start_codon:yes stop_codon:yes gene_type:complete
MKRSFRLLAFSLSFLCLSAGVAAERRGTAVRLHSLFGEAWEFTLDESPLFATSVGDHRNDDRLSSETLADYDRRLARRRSFIETATRIERKHLSPADQVNLDIFIRLQKDEVSELEFNSHLMPITNRGGFHVWFPELPKRVPLGDEEDYDNYVARLNDFGRHAGEQIELMREGIRRGIVLPAVVLEGYQGTITPHIVEDPSASLLYAPVRAFPVGFHADERLRITGDITEAIQEVVVPAYQAFGDFMKDEYIPAARGSIGAAALPQGREFYRYRVRHFTTLDISPEEVHQLGLNEVARIRTEMEGVIDRVEFKGSFDEFLAFLRTDERFYAKTGEQLQKEIAYVLKRMDGQLPRLFSILPRMSYGIRVVPEYIAPRTTAAYYSPPAGDGTRAGFYYINIFNLKGRPLYQVEALSLHEAVPGHHLQIAIQQELKGIPRFRRYAGFTAFVEGWALYAERLGLEVGFYEDPYSDFGRLSYEMWRACRLVVDTGMHYLGWTRKQAIDFMKENTALSMHNITAEVDRYISWPGQALAYKMGELKIRELRSGAEERLGDRFDVRGFHDAVLRSGAVPLDVLELNIENYIQAADRE